MANNARPAGEGRADDAQSMVELRNVLELERQRHVSAGSEKERELLTLRAELEAERERHGRAAERAAVLQDELSQERARLVAVANEARVAAVTDLLNEERQTEQSMRNLITELRLRLENAESQLFISAS